MEDNPTYGKANWDWVFALPFIILLIYIFL